MREYRKDVESCLDCPAQFCGWNEDEVDYFYYCRYNKCEGPKVIENINDMTNEYIPEWCELDKKEE